MKRVKKSNDNIKQDLLTTKAFDEYLCTYSFKKKPVSDAFIENLAKELIIWASEDENAFKLSQFYLKKGIHSSDFHRWIDRSQNLRASHSAAMQYLGNRREIGALRKKLDAGLVASSMSLYDKDWKMLAEEKAKLSDKGEGGASIRVVLEQFPNSPLVPDKKVDNAE